MIDWMFAHQAWTAFLIFAAVLIIFSVNLIAAAHSIDDEDEEDYEEGIA